MTSQTRSAASKKRACDAITAPSPKRLCASQSRGVTKTLTVQQLLALTEDEVFSLPKAELRDCFLKLQGIVSRGVEDRIRGASGSQGGDDVSGRSNGMVIHDVEFAAECEQDPVLGTGSQKGTHAGGGGLVQRQQQSQRPSKAQGEESKTISPTQEQPPSSPSRCTFLGLPPEIRTLIYSHLLKTSTTVAYIIPNGTTASICGPHPRQLQRPLRLERCFHPSILLVNSQIHCEALNFFYGGPHQTVYITIDHNVWQHKVRRSELLLRREMIRVMRDVHVSFCLGTEKRKGMVENEERDARVAFVRKSARKVAKWLSGGGSGSSRSASSMNGDGGGSGSGASKVGASGAAASSEPSDDAEDDEGGITLLTISWYEPPKTIPWDMKRQILDELRVVRAKEVELCTLNWGLEREYEGRKWEFQEAYLKELKRDFGA